MREKMGSGTSLRYLFRRFPKRTGLSLGIRENFHQRESQVLPPVISA